MRPCGKGPPESCEGNKGRRADIRYECKEPGLIKASAELGPEALVDGFAPALVQLTLRPSRQTGGLSDG